MKYLFLHLLGRFFRVIIKDALSLRFGDVSFANQIYHVLGFVLHCQSSKMAWSHITPGVSNDAGLAKNDGNGGINEAAWQRTWRRQERGCWISTPLENMQHA